MDFNKIVCENFFDYNRELNQSDGIIQAIYHLMHRMRKLHESSFSSLEKRLTRTMHNCRNADDFIKLSKTSFRNQAMRNNELNKYLALLFFTAEWINDQAQRYVDDAQHSRVTDQLVLSMTIIITKEFNFRSRTDWYEFVAHENKNAVERTEIPDYTIPMILGFGIAYLLK